MQKSFYIVVHEAPSVRFVTISSDLSPYEKIFSVKFGHLQIIIYLCGA